uniref:Cytochrome b6-f complex subunit 7 n=2 Tax=Ecklonia TaxID=105406 RepID=A0A8F0FA63_9PHAE|nr:cytochrome b6-f complex subunit VII [Ecklonia radiata]YP_011005218.1 cytochrome b6f complex subunit 7 [Aureophycus aleuticus]YP_011006337.1 cytochrome b6f complex subunit 7 [Ecklonia cava]YP_011006478.1 cytochrome b6f complex subunit 7 [Eisenia bicyclis]YP_011006893.1 cytochrome b6f complex subunit 7 [Lessonia variegata]QWK43236.1 cytochrome b6-f complex subunit VII [Ecklonia arborea]QWK43520.1 cytochrome b6-f complex subunit VII [Ecklonia radicosa]WAM63482.1 cytochrome b6f complex subuni
MGGEILSIGILCFSMVLIGLSLGFLLLKVQGE